MGDRGDVNPEIIRGRSVGMGDRGDVNPLINET
jgi:hypothetical protein